jgi:Na+/proline symporter
MSGALLAILAYVAVQFAIGAYVSRSISTASDYIVAGRTLGLPLIAFAVFGTFFGSEALTATSASVYADGLAGALVDPFCYGLGIILAGLLLATRIRSLNLTTFADFFAQRFSPTIEKLVVLVLLPGSLFWAAAQVRVFGVILNAEAGLGLPAAVLLAAIVVGLYAVVGGLLADSVTDVLHGAVVMAGLVVLGAAVVMALGAAGGSLTKLPADRLVVVASDVSVLSIVEKIAIPICGTLVAVELISRYLGARTPAVAATGTVIGGVLYIAFGLIPIALGLAGAQLIPGLTDTEEIVPRLAATYLPATLYVLFVGAIVSAVLSTVHATLHAPAAHVAHNLLGNMIGPPESLRALWATRATVGALSVVAYALAASSDTIKELVETASAFGSAGVLVTLLFGLFTRFGGPSAALVTILVGIVAWSGAKYALAIQAPYLLALAAALLTYVVVGLTERPARNRA